MSAVSNSYPNEKGKGGWFQRPPKGHKRGGGGHERDLTTSPKKQG